jgi:hypothetical protein
MPCRRGIAGAWVLRSVPERDRPSKARCLPLR